MSGASGRVLIVANRLPVTVAVADGALDISRSAGGLASGLQRPHETSGGRWIGWPGIAGPLAEPLQAELDERLAAMRLVPVTLSADEAAHFYEAFSNGVLWPLFHYLVDQVPLHVQHWDAYEAINERFAEIVAREYRSGDVIWVHDYQLMLVPALLRRRLPDACIGFFLHIPFPASDIFRSLPMREALLAGVLGADLIGFHTGAYLRHFATSLTQVLGLSPEIEQVRWQERDVELGIFPMGIDAASFEQIATDRVAAEDIAALREHGDVRILLGVDRLDYTKGIPRRLLAFEEMLARHPELHERVRLVQVAVPSREGVDAYVEFRELVEASVGRIQGRFGTPRWAPVHYVYRSVGEAELVALYRAADAMLVTPLRDGMNLVAKEFVASRTDGDGVLVLSEFAGAAAEMAEAVLVNPFDIERTADAFHAALTMPEDERRSRMTALRTRVQQFDVHHWVQSFLDRLAATERRSGARRASVLGPPPADVIRSAERLALLLDYDGTLVPIEHTPELAAPTPDLLDLLERLAKRPGTEVHVVSGRPRDVLDAWLGALPIALHAEHALWSREGGSSDWVRASVGDLSWRDPVRDILDAVTERTPGSLLEEKTAGFAWHYRAADPEYGAARANELRVHLGQLLSNTPVEVLVGHKLVEVRPQGVTKGLVAKRWRHDSSAPLVVAIGDDQTDEDLFDAVPERAITVRVGPGETTARFRLESQPEVRGLLESLLA